jgi:cytochrome c oxidase subunit 4
MEEHITPRRNYFFVYLALMLLLAATIGAAMIDLGPLNWLIAISIAIVKAVLVILFFMHVRASSQVVRVFAIAGFFWLAILIGLSLTDYLTRPQGWDILLLR